MGFPTTRWSLIVASGAGADARAAWDELAARYRAPVHAYFRARHGAAQAEDLTQRFFADSIAGGWGARADAARGGFRTFLRVLLQRFGERHVERAAVLTDEADLRRGDDRGPDDAYDRAFARALVARAFARLEAENAGTAHSALLPLVLEGGDDGELKRIATATGVAHNTMIQRLRRLRLRFRALMREELAELVDEGGDVDAELRELQRAIAAG